MMRTLLAEELRTLGTVHAKTIGVLVAAGIGVLAISLVPYAMNADVPSLMVTLWAAVAFILPAPIVVTHGLAQYWQSMHGRRGYLTMSLPARGREVFGAKIIYLLCAAVVALAVTAVGLAVVIAVRAQIAGTSPAEVWHQALAYFEVVGAVKVAIVIGIVVLQILTWVLMWAAVMSISAQTRWNHLGIGGVVLGMAALYLVCQVVYAVAMILMPVGLDMTTGEIVVRSMLPELLRGDEVTVFGLGFVPASILLCVGLAWWAVRALERHASLR